MQYLEFLLHLVKDSLLYGSPIGVVAYFIANNRGLPIELLEAILCTAGLILCILILQFLLHTKNELYDLLAKHSNNDDNEGE